MALQSSSVIVSRSPLCSRVVRALLTVLAIPAAVTASADPINSNTTTFTARCTGLGDITAVAVFVPSAFARNATSAFHVVGSNTVLLWHAPGTERLAVQAGTSCEITSINGEPAFAELAAFITGGPVALWNPAVDWKNFPDQANPSHDSYGNPNVWRYLASFGFLHDPDTYELLPNYQAAGEQWNDPAYVNLFVEHGSMTSPELHMHSYGGRVASFGRNSIVAWTSPVNGRIRIDGSVALEEVAACPSGSGIIWSIYQDATPVLETVVPAGEGTTFGFSINVSKGQTLYFVHDPGWDSDCDFAAVRLQITKP